MGSNDEKQTPVSDGTSFPPWGGTGDPTPKQMEAMGAVEMPKDKAEAQNAVMRLTQDWQHVFYWTPKPQSWLDRKLGGHEPPHGRNKADRSLVQCRPWDECALVIHDPQLWDDGLVLLQYADKFEIILAVEDLHHGLSFRGNEVRRKFVPCRPGERDVMGVLHKGG